MLALHDIADCAFCRTRKHELYGPDLGWARAIVTDALAARKFDFGELHLELAGVDEEGVKSYVTPGLTDTEKRFWHDRLVPLPFDRCWYECTVDDARIGLLVVANEVGWEVTQVILHRTWIEIDCIFVRALFDDPPDTPFRCVAPQTVAANLEEFEAKAEKMNAASRLNLARYLTLMLTSKTTETKFEKAKPVSVATRRALGRTPPQDHAVITIVPKRFVSAAGGERGVGGGRRLHWRRSHLRHFSHSTPGSKWCPEMEHEGTTGWWVTVIPRHLVGRAELGEVTHEYRVKHDDAKEVT